MPAVQNALFQGRLTVVMNNGRNLYSGINQEGIQSPFNLDAHHWPKGGPTSPDEVTFANSTDYLTWS